MIVLESWNDGYAYGNGGSTAYLDGVEIDQNIFKLLKKEEAGRHTLTTRNGVY